MTSYPVKVSWTGDARTKLETRELEPAIADGEAHGQLARKTLSRLKTRVVIRNAVEAEALLTALENICMRQPAKGAGTPRDGCTLMTNAHKAAYERVKQEIEDSL